MALHAEVEHLHAGHLKMCDSPASSRYHFAGHIRMFLMRIWGGEDLKVFRGSYTLKVFCKGMQLTPKQFFFC